MYKAKLEGKKSNDTFIGFPSTFNTPGACSYNFVASPGNFLLLHLVSISSIFYAKLLQAQISNAQKDSQVNAVFFALLRPTWVKALHKMLMKLTPGVNFTNIFMQSFYSWGSQKRKKTFKSSMSFALFGICSSKSCFWNIGEIDPCRRSYVTFFFANKKFFRLFAVKLDHFNIN